MDISLANIDNEEAGNVRRCPANLKPTEARIRALVVFGVRIKT